jgi:hypothetical protein
MLRKAAAEGRLVKTSDGKYMVKNATTGHLAPAERFLTMTACDDFCQYARKTCKEPLLQWHPSETRLVRHTKLWPGRKLRILFFPGNAGWSPLVWTTAWVEFWRELTLEDAREINGEVKWFVAVDFIGENPSEKSFQPGSLVEMHGLQSASGKDNNGRFAVVAKRLKNVPTGRLPVLFCDESCGEFKLLSVKPENLKLVSSMDFRVHQINVQGGGILAPSSSVGAISEDVYLSFEWLERVSEEPPWYFVLDPPDAKWREPFIEGEVEKLRAVNMTKLENCLARKDCKGVEEMCEDMIRTIGIFTAFGSKEGLREARLILLAHPFTLVWTTLSQLVDRFDHFHILHVLAVVYEDLARKTNGFRDKSLNIHRNDILSLRNMQSDQDSLSLSQSWCSVVIDTFRSVREYRAVIQFGQVLDEIWGKAWKKLQGSELQSDHVCSYAFAHNMMGNYEAALAVTSSKGPSLIEIIQAARNFATGTLGIATKLVTLSKEVYSPPDDGDSDSLSSADDSIRVCRMCGSSAGVVARCGGCQQLDYYCSREVPAPALVCGTPQSLSGAKNDWSMQGLSMQGLRYRGRVTLGALGALTHCTAVESVDSKTGTTCIAASAREGSRTFDLGTAVALFIWALEEFV